MIWAVGGGPASPECGIYSGPHSSNASLLPPSAQTFASSAISDNDHSKLARVVTFEIFASPASLAHTAVPVKDATLSALEASFFRWVGGCFRKSRNGRRSSQCDLFLASILSTSLTLTSWTFLILRSYWRHRQASYRIYQGLLNGGWCACLGLWSTSEFGTTKGSVGKQNEGNHIMEAFVSYTWPAVAIQYLWLLRFFDLTYVQP